MADHTLVGQNYTTPDLFAKVTGRAKYSEDFRADGMLFAKLLLSPMPHAKVRRIDASAALAMPGVRAILTPAELPEPADSVSDLGQVIKADPHGERPLTDEPLYQGEPILAIAAVDEVTAVEALERVIVDLEPLPFVVDPLVSLRPGGPNARTDGNVWARPTPAPGAPAGPTAPEVREWKWTAEDFAEFAEGRMPRGQAPDEWSYGDVDEGFKNAALVLDETFVTPNTSHHTMEPRSAMAYWQNGKLYLHCSTQSTVQTVMSVSRWLRLEPTDIVVVSEYTGGGFGSKATGTITAMIPALLAKKTGTPVMMRVSREEEVAIGGARPSLLGRVKAGFAKDGRLTAVDMYVVADNGPYEPQGDPGMSGRQVSLLYQPPAMRWRGVTVLTNTPTRRAQRAPGGMQGVGIMEHVLTKAAGELGVDHVAIHKLNAPEGRAQLGPANREGRRAVITSAYVKEALDRGAELFAWEDKKSRRVTTGTKRRGIGVSMSSFVAGSTGFDGLLVIKPDGRVAIQSGIGNLGTESVSDCHRVAADVLGVPWEKVDLTWGNTSKHLPWTCVSGGSQTTHAMTRAAHAVAMDARAKLQAIAAHDLGGAPEDYEVANERVARKGGGRGLTFAEAASRAIALGGAFDGHEAPENVNAVTKRAVAGLAGQGLVAVARDAYPHDGQTHSFVVGFAEVEVDVETGVYRILDYAAVGDVGTVIHPRALGGQILGGSMQGIGHALAQKWVYDQHYGMPLTRRFYQSRPPSILDAPAHMQWDAVNLPDPQTPVGARGVGEPPVGAGFAAVLNALADALGPEVFQRAPVTADVILTAIERGRRPVEHALTMNV
ncbi:MAG: xanthine dehydrogenase family protein molybdopterin-binding subunit [Vicinamibacterales bacterium]